MSPPANCLNGRPGRRHLCPKSHACRTLGRSPVPISDAERPRRFRWTTASACNSLRTPFGPLLGARASPATWGPAGPTRPPGRTPRSVPRPRRRPCPELCHVPPSAAARGDGTSPKAPLGFRPARRSRRSGRCRLREAPLPSPGLLSPARPSWATCYPALGPRPPEPPRTGVLPPLVAPECPEPRRFPLKTPLTLTGPQGEDVSLSVQVGGSW